MTIGLLNIRTHKMLLNELLKGTVGPNSVDAPEVLKKSDDA
jgi:hypothetical protein